MSLGLGSLTQFHGDVQIDNDGNTNGTKFFPYMNLGIGWQLSRRFSLLSDLGWVFPHERSVNTVSRSCYYLNLHLAIEWGSFLKFGFFSGGGFFLTSISGDGGKVKLYNGTGTTNYPRPFNSSLASNLTFNNGAFIKIKSFSLEVMSSIFNLANSIKRSSQYSVTLKFNIPLGKAKPQKKARPQYTPRHTQPDYQTDENFF